MLITDTFADYKQEICELYRRFLDDEFQSRPIFGIFDGDILMAMGGVKNYSGTWYLRGDVVKPEFRGRGLQRALIRERLEYIEQLDKGITVVRASIYPWNEHSIDNYVAEGFKKQKKPKKLKDGSIVNVYRYEF